MSDWEMRARELRNPEIVSLEYRIERLECVLQEMVDRHRSAGRSRTKTLATGPTRCFTASAGQSRDLVLELPPHHRRGTRVTPLLGLQADVPHWLGGRLGECARSQPTEV